MHILGQLEEALPAPRADLTPNAPRLECFTVPKEFIGAIIGPGGKIIQGIQEKSGASVSIEETEGEGRVEVASSDKAALDKAMAMIKAIVARCV